MNQTYEVSAPALHAARVLMANFILQERPGGRVLLTEKNVALLIDVCTHSFRAKRAMNDMVRTVGRMSKHELAANMDLLQEAVRAIEIVANGMPNYGPEELPRRHQDSEPPFTRDQMKEISLIQAEVMNARTPAEEQKILRAAGIVR